MPIIFIALAFISSGCCINPVTNESKPIANSDQPSFRFASLEEGRGIIGASDDWVKSLSPFDRKLRMKRNDDVSESEFLAFTANQVLEWNQDEIDEITKSIDIMKQKMDQSGINLDLPAEVLLIKTTGSEEGGAAYTRQNAIIIPEGCLSPSVEGILHELFHVMTRHNPSIREPLYNIIGYRLCNDVKLPETIVNCKITDPDAFHNNYYIEVLVKGIPTRVIPIIYSKTDQYTGGNLFSYITFKFMAIESVNNVYQPLIKEGEPVLIDITEISNFYEQIGRNTDYIIHPEESMANNFAYMVVQKTDVPNPEILDSVKQVLSTKKSN